MKCAEPIKKLSNVKLSPELLKLKSVIDKSSDENIKNISKLNINKLWITLKNIISNSTDNINYKNNKKTIELLLKNKNSEPTVESVEMKQDSSNKNSSIIIIRYSNNIIKKIELTEIEIFILKTAIFHNRGFINLLNPSRREIINNLFNKGLVTIESSTLNHCEGLVKVSDCVRKVFE